MLFSKFIKKVAFSALAVLALPFMVLAQGGATEGLALAEINVGDAVMNVTDTQINVTFNITNMGSVPQSDIRYGTELIMATAGGGQVMVDRLVSEETVSVAAGASLFKNAVHPLAGVAPGEYSVWIVARTTGGIMLGLTNAGTVNVTDSSAVSFLADTCALTIDESDSKYTLDQGVDVAAEEDLYLTCVVKNYTAMDIKVSPDFSTHRRTAFGDLETMDYPEAEVIEVAAGEEKMVTLLLPKAAAPQAYDLVVALKDTASAEVVSSHLGVHYVLRGESATIQTVNFDKVKYAAGEPMNLTLFWSGSADGFADSRSGVTTELSGEVTAVLAVTDTDGAVCIDPITQTIKPGEVKLQATAKIDCIDPIATISLVDKSGVTLDTRSVEITAPIDTASELISEGKSMVEKNPYAFLALVALAVACLTLLVSTMRHKKTNLVEAAKLLVLGVVAAGGLLGGAAPVEAVSWTHVWSNSSGVWDMGVAVNTNRTTYAPGETITLSSSVWNISCTNNVVAVHSLTATLQAQTRVLSDIDVNSASTVYGSGTMVAPTTPGTYTVRATIFTKARGETSYRDITITVVAPAVAAVGSFDSVNASTCSVSGWAYDADSSASSIAVHIYRDQRAGMGGTYVGACSANQYRSDVNTAYGISGNHGFNCVLPASYTGTGNHNLYIHAIDTNGGPNNVIGGSPRALNCLPPPPPPATPSATISGAGCTIPVGGSTCGGTVTWTINNATTPNVYNNTAGASYSTAASGTNQPITLTHGTTTLQARDGSSVIGSATLLVGVVCASGSSWNSSSCVANSANATLNTTGCSIALGNNSCQGTIDDWDINFASNPNIYNDTTNNQLFTGANGGPENITLPRGNTTVVARDGSGSPLDTEIMQAVCDPVSAPNWDGSVCTNAVVPPPPAPPQISLDLNKEIVRSGETAIVTSEITAGYPTECTLQGATAAPIVFNHSGSPATATYTHTTRPLTAAQIIRLTCEPDPAIVGVSSATSETRINVVPSVQEI